MALLWKHWSVPRNVAASPTVLVGMPAVTQSSITKNRSLFIGLFVSADCIWVGMEVVGVIDIALYYTRTYDQADDVSRMAVRHLIKAICASE